MLNRTKPRIIQNPWMVGLKLPQVLEKPFLDFSLDVVPCRRHSPAPERHDPRNEILQALDAHESGPDGRTLGDTYCLVKGRHINWGYSTKRCGWWGRTHRPLVRLLF